MAEIEGGSVVKAARVAEAVTVTERDRERGLYIVRGSGRDRVREISRERGRRKIQVEQL